MLNTIRTAFRIKDLRKKLLFTLGLLILVRLGAHIPIPGIDAEYFKSWFEENTNGTFNILSAFSGGSFERMSLLRLVSPIYHGIHHHPAPGRSDPCTRRNP